MYIFWAKNQQENPKWNCIYFNEQVQYNLLIKLYGLNKLYIFYIILSYSEYFL